MSSIGHEIVQALEMAFAMFYETLWALALGFTLSGVVQAMVSRGEMARTLGGENGRPVVRATMLGAASSSCSYAAIAIAKSMFRKGGGFAPSMAFMFASTNLVFELGIVIWLLLGWQFTLAEFFGGIVMIAILWIALRIAFSKREVERARSHLDVADDPHAGHGGMGDDVQGLGWRQRFASRTAWTHVSHYFVMDLSMLWKDLVAGFLLAGALAAWVPDSWWRTAFLPGHGVASTLWSALIGPLIAVFSFVCSVGNVPLAAVLWTGGISFAGVISFIFADLIVLPIIHIQARYYGTRFAIKLAAVFYVVMVIAGLVTDGAFSIAGLIPEERKAIPQVATISFDYHLVLNVLAVFITFTMFAVARRSPMHHDHTGHAGGSATSADDAMEHHHHARGEDGEPTNGQP